MPSLPRDEHKLMSLGWHARAGDQVLHLWHIRTHMATAVSSCGEICRDALCFTQIAGARCPACESMEELRTLGPASPYQPILIYQ